MSEKGVEFTMLEDDKEEKRLTKEEKKVQSEILENLEKLGGKVFRDDDVTYEGTKFVIPARMSAAGALKFLERHVQQQNEETDFTRMLNYRPWDGAHAFSRAVKKLTGTSGIGRASFSFFGKQPPEMRTINIGFDEQTQIPWGSIELPIFEGVAHLGGMRTRETGVIFVIQITAPRKYRHGIEGFFKVIEEELETNSIYRGKAIDAAEEPNFKDVSVVDPEQFVFSQQTLADLDAQLWWPIEDIEGVRRNNLRVKRAVLLEGSYGTGKTETANITAKKCVENGWTFIQVRANRDSLADAMTTAKLYQPAVVFFEDVDVIADTGRNVEVISQLLDVFDGMDAKHTDIVAVLTTNHVDKIHKGMLRPGRLDGIIHLGALDRDGVEKLAKIQLGSEAVFEVDFDKVYQAMKGYMPAFVNRAYAKAVEYSRGAEFYTTKDLVNAAEGLRAQFELYMDAGETSSIPTFGEYIAPHIVEALNKTEIIDSEGDSTDQLLHSRE